MKTITLKAIYDGEHIRLEDDYALPKDAKLLVTMLEPTSEDDLEEFRRDWSRLSLQALARAYGEDEPEYTDDMLMERNPLYEER